MARTAREPRVGPDRDGEARRGPGARRPAHREAEATVDLSQSPGPAQARKHDGVGALGEDPARTAASGASEAAQAQLGGAPLPGQIAQAAPVMAVDPDRETLASRTGRDARPGPGLDDQPVRIEAGAPDDQLAGQERRQGLGGHAILEFGKENEPRGGDSRAVAHPLPNREGEKDPRGGDPMFGARPAPEAHAERADELSQLRCGNGRLE